MKRSDRLPAARALAAGAAAGLGLEGTRASTTEWLVVCALVGVAVAAVERRLARRNTR